jgi:hypothetical protein
MPRVENERKFRLMTFLILVAVILLLEVGYDNFGSDARFLNDYYDRSDYAHIGARILTGDIPYVDGVTEYPQIPVYLFRGLTWLASRIFPAFWPPEAGFLIIWAFFIGVISMLVDWQVWRMLPEGKKRLAWLMFLPAAIYFCMNRFDILPAFLGLLAVMAVRKERFSWAAVLLAIGAFTKWYLVLIFPFYLVYEWKHQRRLPWRSVVIFAGVSLLIVLPTFLQGGWQAVWQPYSWHLGRLAESGTALSLASTFFGESGLGWINSAKLLSVFTILGFSGILLIFIKGQPSVRKLMLTSIVSLLVFIFFTRIFSPQWWLWILPFLILTIDDKLDLILIVLYDLLSYASFPLAYDLTGRASTIYLLLTSSLLILMIIFMIRTMTKLIRPDGEVVR